MVKILLSNARTELLLPVLTKDVSAIFATVDHIAPH